MAIVQNIYTGNGSTTLYSLSFSYLDTADVKVTINGVPTAAFVFVNDSTIQFLSAPAAGTTIAILRETDEEEAQATFFAGSSIKAADLNLNFTQVLYVLQELVVRSLNKFGDTMAGILNMGGFRITNLGTPTTGTDAAPKAYVDGYINTSYLGASATAPLTRPGGVPLQVGDQYFSTSENIIKVWTGGNWAYSVATGSIVRWRKTASAGNTTLSGLDDVGINLSYIINNEQVYLNGALQTRNVDYTASTGTSITFTPALLAGDVVELHAVQGVLTTTIPDGSVGELQLANGAVTSAKIANNTIVNLDVSDTAAIAGSKIQAATTSNAGVVQLTDSVSSTSITTAATPSAVKSTYDLASSALPISGGTMTGPITFAAGQTINGYAPLASPTFTGQPYVNGSYRGNIVAVSALDIDCSAGNFFTKTINGASTFTVSNVPSSRAYAFTLELTHTSGTITWFSGVVWPGGAAPTLTTGKVHLFMFVTDDGGTTWRASSLINY